MKPSEFYGKMGWAKRTPPGSQALKIYVGSNRVKVHGHIVPHLIGKLLVVVIYESKGLSCDSTFSICLGVLIIANLQHQLVFFDYQLLGTLFGY